MSREKYVGGRPVGHVQERGVRRQGGMLCRAAPALHVDVDRDAAPPKDVEVRRRPEAALAVDSPVPSFVCDGRRKSVRNSVLGCPKQELLRFI